MSECLNRADEFKRTKKGHRPASMPLNETHFLSYKPGSCRDAKKAALKRAAVCVIGSGESALCGHRHAFTEKQLVLRAGKGRSGLVAQIVHAAEELAIHHERKIAPHG